MVESGLKRVNFWSRCLKFSLVRMQREPDEAESSLLGPQTLSVRGGEIRKEKGSKYERKEIEKLIRKEDSIR